MGDLQLELLAGSQVVLIVGLGRFEALLQTFELAQQRRLQAEALLELGDPLPGGLD